MIAASLALASTAVAEKPEWERLFDDGLTVKAAGDGAGACKLFERSFALNRKSAGTMANLADCRESDGRIPEAWQLWRDAADAWKQQGFEPRVTFARTNAARVAALATTVVIAVPAPETTDLVITVNGEPVAAAAEIQRVVDPGEVVVVAKAPGYRRFAFTRKAGAGDTVAVAVTLDARGADQPDDPPASIRTERRRGRVRLAIGTGVAAGATLVGGLVIAVIGKQRYDEVAGDPALCSGEPLECTPDGKQRIRDAQLLANVGTGFAIAGGALAVTSLIIYFTAPRDRVTPVVTPYTIGVAVRF